MNGKFKRILLKMSGEALAGEKGRGIDFDFTGEVCKAVKQCVDAGVQVSVVVGGGNYWRGGKDGGDRMVRARADYMGMLATAMNSVALVDALEKAGWRRSSRPPSGWSASQSPSTGTPPSGT